MEEEFYDLSSFAVSEAEMEGKSLLETVKMVKPNIIIGAELTIDHVTLITYCDQACQRAAACSVRRSSRP